MINLQAKFQIIPEDQQIVKLKWGGGGGGCQRRGNHNNLQCADTSTT